MLVLTRGLALLLLSQVSGSDNFLDLNIERSFTECGTDSAWTIVELRSLGLEPQTNSSLALSATPFSCASSYPFTLYPGLLEFYIFIDTSNNSGVEVFVFDDDNGGKVVQHYEYPSNDIAPRWRKIQLPIEKQFLGHITLVGHSQAEDKVIVNSIRYTNDHTKLLQTNEEAPGLLNEKNESIKSVVIDNDDNENTTIAAEDDNNNTAIVEDDDNTAVDEDVDNTAVDEDDNNTAVDEDDDNTAVDEDYDNTAVDADDDNTAIDEDDDNTAVDEDDDNTAVDEDDDNTAIDEDEDNTVVDEDEDNTAIDEDDDNTAVDEDDDNTAIDEDEDNTAIDEDEDNTAIDEDEDNTAVDEDEDNTAIDEDDDNTAVDEDDDNTADDNENNAVDEDTDGDNNNVDGDNNEGGDENVADSIWNVFTISLVSVAVVTGIALISIGAYNLGKMRGVDQIPDVIVDDNMIEPERIIPRVKSIYDNNPYKSFSRTSTISKNNW